MTGGTIYLESNQEPITSNHLICICCVGPLQVNKVIHLFNDLNVVESQSRDQCFVLFYC